MNAAHVEIGVEQGAVSLEGRVDTEDLADSIVSFAEQTPGVVSVDSKLTRPRRKPASRRRERACA
jgi:osmotically-inducible protein OsmY